MKQKKSKSKSTFPREYETYPLAGVKSRDSATNAAIPSDEDVKEAKDWVDFNHK